MKLTTYDHKHLKGTAEEPRGKYAHSCPMYVKEEFCNCYPVNKDWLKPCPKCDKRVRV